MDAALALRSNPLPVLSQREVDRLYRMRRKPDAYERLDWLLAGIVELGAESMAKAARVLWTKVAALADDSSGGV